MGNDFLVLDVYLNERGKSVKIEELNIFKDHHIVAQPGATQQYTMMNGCYLVPFGWNFTMVMVNTSLNYGNIFKCNNVKLYLMFLCYESSTNLLATS